MNREETNIIQRRYESAYYHKVRKALKGIAGSLIDVVNQDGVEAGISHVQSITDTKDLPLVIQDLYLKVGGRFARRQWRDLLSQRRSAKPPVRSRSTGSEKSDKIAVTGGLQTKGFGFNAEWVEFIKRFLFQYLLEKITYRVAENVREELLKILQQSIEEGWGVDKTVRELEELPFTRKQAARIVRTEVTRAANTGAMAAGETFEFEQQKEWISAEDARTRGVDPEDHASHIGLNGTIIDYDDVFTDPRNGDMLRYPGDPGGNGIPLTSPGSTINCRCNVAVIAKLDHEGRLIPKKKTTSVIYPRRRQIITI